MEQHKVVIKGIYFGKCRTFPDLNDYIHACGRHPRIGAKMKRDYQTIAANAIRKQVGRIKLRTPVRIHYTFYESDQRRDPSNIASFFVKVFEDALQQCGVLKNDNRVCLKGYSQEFFIDNRSPRVEVVIEEVRGTQEA